MKLACTDRIINKPGKYASSRDFCELFTKEMNSLYLLGFLLTGDPEKAEQCFVAGLEDSLKGNSVFKEWARSWAKRMIVENAVRIIAPHSNYTGGTAPAVDLNSEPGTVRPDRALIEAVLDLPNFERFVFVMSVLEGYSDQDCFVLLGCSLPAISEARVRAYMQVAWAYVQNDAPGRVELFDRDDHSVEALVH
jgi:DNA-directed RNA polymerase specialized sigma24 family protein